MHTNSHPGLVIQHGSAAPMWILADNDTFIHSIVSHAIRIKRIHLPWYRSVSHNVKNDTEYDWVIFSYPLVWTFHRDHSVPIEEDTSITLETNHYNSVYNTVTMTDARNSMQSLNHLFLVKDIAKCVSEFDLTDVEESKTVYRNHTPSQTTKTCEYMPKCFRSHHSQENITLLNPFHLELEISLYCPQSPNKRSLLSPWFIIRKQRHRTDLNLKLLITTCSNCRLICILFH